jgi:hypothetical protein
MPRHRYRLEGMNGGKDPNAPYPGEWSWGYRALTADCIGAVMWAIGTSRFHEQFGEYGGAMNTDSILLDAGVHPTKKGHGRRTFFAPIDRPELAALAVRPGIFDAKTGARLRPGHVRLVVDPLPAEFDPAEPSCRRDVHLIDCASTRSKQTGAAIAERTGLSLDGYVWLRYLRFRN